MIQFTVPPSQTIPVTLRTWVRNNGISLTQWRKIKASGTILLNNQPAFPYTMVKSGDQICLSVISETGIMPTDIPLSIAYEDEHLLVIDKQAGLLIHPAKDNHTMSLANAVIYYYRKNNSDFGFHPVLRLDRNTSGLVLIAKQPYIQHMLSNKPLIITKRYLAVVAGCPLPQEGLIDAPIARHPNSIIQRIVDTSGQEARTRYRTIICFQEASLLEIELLTGRTHQIRVHLSHSGHPLLGDDLYGGSVSLITRQALHAHHLSFTHPISQKTIAISSPLPEDLQTLLYKLGNKY